MASRTRIISQSKALYVTPTGTLPSSPLAVAESGILAQQLHRVDTFSFDIDLAGARQDVREFGQLARIGTLTMSELNPTFSLGYFLGNGENEGLLGFDTDGITTAGANSSQFISGIITEDKAKREKNLFALTVAEGQDAFSPFDDGTAGAAGRDTFTPAQSATHDVVSFGNCTINSYTVNFAVGEIPRVDIEGEAQNIQFTEGSQGGSSGLYNPSINKDGARADTGQLVLPIPSTGDMDVLVLRPEDVTLSFSRDEFDLGGTNLADMHVQSASIEVPMSRGNISALGAERAVAKPLEFPINVTMSISAILKNVHKGALDMVLTGVAGDQTTNATINVTNNDGGALSHVFTLQKAVLDSQNFAIGIDDNETIDMTFSAQIGGPDTTDQGLFYSGASPQSKIFDDVSVYPFNRLYAKNNSKAPY
tara:strand:+ start:1627 stop:2892 length:1266 start_codon:yes stop_codon:yes gene_type:complete